MERQALLFALVLARVTAFLAAMPLFGGRSTPRIVKAAFALSLTLFWLGEVTPSPELLTQLAGRLAGTGGVAAGLWLPLGVALFREVVLGAAVGLVFSLFLAPVRIAGEFAAQQIGLAASQALGIADTGGSPLTIILESLAGLLFLGLDGHHLVLALLHASFAKYPLGVVTGGTLAPVPLGEMVQAVATAESLGVLLAAPLALALFVVTVSLALMGRVAPQLNIYSVGFTAQALVAISAVLFLLSDILNLMTRMLTQMGQVVKGLI